MEPQKSVILLPAEKGKATLIMETDEYQEKITKLVSDKATYEKLNNDPTRRYDPELIRILSTLERREGHKMPVLVLISLKKTCK